MYECVRLHLNIIETILTTFTKTVSNMLFVSVIIIVSDPRFKGQDAAVLIHDYHGRSEDMRQVFPLTSWTSSSACILTFRKVKMWVSESTLIQKLT